MSATPSRLPRDAASRAHPAFAPTMPFELEAITPECAAADPQEAWHDTHPQGGEEFDTVPGALLTSPAANAAHTPRPADPSDPTTGSFREALGGLQVRELVNEELFQRLFGQVG